MPVKYKPICCGDESKKSFIVRDFFHRYCTRKVWFFSGLTLLYIALYFGGILTHLFEESFKNYSYPLNIVGVRELVEKIDRYHLKSQYQNLLFGINNVNYQSVVEAVESIQNEGGDYSSDIVPLTQFRDLEFSIDINPSCYQQWGLGQSRSTLLSLTSQQPFITVVIVVKSAVNNYAHRDAIRNSWYLNQTKELFSFKTVFMVGKCHEKNLVPSSASRISTNGSWSINDCTENILRESMKYGDIVQSSGIDSYYNNTIKTYMTLRWLNERCPSDFSLAIDDDYVFEVDNFIEFMHQQASIYLPSVEPSSNTQMDESHASQNHPNVNNPSRAAQTSVGSSSLEETTGILSDSTQQDTTRKITTALNSDETARKLIALRLYSKTYVWAGYVRFSAHPLRSPLSKWYISLEDYAFNKYPPFITGGYVLMSFKTIKHLYYATYFTRSFKFDDVYLGILAHKLGLYAFHSDNFMCSIYDYMDANPIHSNSTECIGVHEIKPRKLVELWQMRS